MKDQLKERYQNLDINELVKIVESTDYTEVATEVAKEVLEENTTLSESIHQAAINYWTVEITENFKDYLYSQEIPNSHFLPDKELKNIMTVVFNEWKAKQDLMSIDTTKYWFF